MTVGQAAEDPHAHQAGIGLVAVPEVWPPLEPVPAPVPALAALTARLSGPEGSWPQQFALLLAETLAGARPVQQILPLLAGRASRQLHRLLPLFSDGHRPRMQRVLTARPTRDVIEMTMVVLVGPRARALAVRLERSGDADPGAARPGRPGKLTGPWLCTDIEGG